METLIHVENFIDGVHGKSDSYIDSFDPSTGKVFARIADSDGRDAELAIGAAQKAFSSWSKLDVNVRSKIILRIADILESRLEEFARAESRDQGKPLWLARSVEIPRAVQNFRSFATSILHRRDRSTFVESQGALNYTSREPVGVAVLISPWNLPLYLLTFKIAPAIACGNTVVCKPSEFTSLTAFMLCQVLVDAGLPNGVVNMVFGTGPRIGNALVTDPRTRLISFTGSTATAEKIRAASAPFSKRLSLELGGKNAAVIFDDCNIGKCISTTIRSSFLNQGEVCLCTSRIFVQRNIYKTFLEKFLTETRLMKVGDPRQDSNFMGALVSKEHFEKVTRYVNLARSEGLNVECGNEPLNLAPEFSQGYFMRPVVLTGVPDSSRLMQEEIFGPVVCIVEFDEENEVIDRVNNSCYGLCATVWSSNIDVVHRVAKKLEVGTVWANCWLVRDLHVPFGGVKSSGIGREGIFQSMNFYTEQKNTCIQLG